MGMGIKRVIVNFCTHSNPCTAHTVWEPPGHSSYSYFCFRCRFCRWHLPGLKLLFPLQPPSLTLQNQNHLMSCNWIWRARKCYEKCQRLFHTYYNVICQNQHYFAKFGKFGNKDLKGAGLKHWAKILQTLGL